MTDLETWQRVTAELRARDTVSEDEIGTGESVAPPANTALRPSLSRSATAGARIVAPILEALRAGARSAATAPDDTRLTYADGWRAAATLAELAAFDSARPRPE